MTSIQYSTPSKDSQKSSGVVQAPFCMWVHRSLCHEPHPVNFTEMNFTNDSSPVREKHVKTTYNGMTDHALKTIEIETHDITEEAHDTIYGNLYSYTTYEAGQSFTTPPRYLMPYSYTAQENCPWNCHRLCHNYSVAPDITITSSVSQASDTDPTDTSGGTLVQGVDYVVERNKCGLYRYIKFINDEIDQCGVLTIQETGGERITWCQIKRKDCRYLTPFNITLKANTIWCDGNNTQTFEFENCVVTSDMEIMLPKQEQDENIALKYKFTIQGYLVAQNYYDGIV